MNATPHSGPCADYEYDLLDQHDGTLPAERVAPLARHLASCARCRDWLADYARMDAGLGAAMPRPALSHDFDARLAARIATLRRPAVRTDTREAADRDYRRMLEDLGRGAKWKAALNAVATAAAVGCAWVVVRAIAVQAEAALVPALGAQEQLMALGFVGSLIALAGLAYTRRVQP